MPAASPRNTSPCPPRLSSWPRSPSRSPAGIRPRSTGHGPSRDGSAAAAISTTRSRPPRSPLPRGWRASWSPAGAGTASSSPSPWRCSPGSSASRPASWSDTRPGRVSRTARGSSARTTRTSGRSCTSPGPDGCGSSHPGRSRRPGNRDRAVVQQAAGDDRQRQRLRHPPERLRPVRHRHPAGTERGPARLPSAHRRRRPGRHAPGQVRRVDALADLRTGGGGAAGSGGHRAIGHPAGDPAPPLGPCQARRGRGARARGVARTPG